ncbi:hypothetical protein [Nostoc favosum]|nr:hypothetical protein [Nostoc favosum]
MGDEGAGGEINSKFKIQNSKLKNFCLLPPARTASSFPMPHAPCPMPNAP